MCSQKIRNPQRQINRYMKDIAGCYSDYSVTEISLSGSLSQSKYQSQSDFILNEFIFHLAGDWSSNRVREKARPRLGCSSLHSLLGVGAVN